MVTPELRAVVEKLLDDLKPGDCLDAKEYRLSREFHALPLGLNLWSYEFLTPTGEVISTGLEANELSRSVATEQELILMLVWGAERYPQLGAFIPSRGPNSIVCRVCDGTRVWGTKVPGGGPAECFFCGGLGWTTNDA